jgi:hypothetical protein
LAIAAAVVVAAGLAGLNRWHAAPAEPVGLFTSLPILWSDNPDLRAMLDPQQDPHWAKAAIELRGTIVPLDTLDAAKLNRLRRLVLAQPRPLSGEENVALDTWLRGGGRLLLLADPMLTEHSSFAVGDRRRPQDMVLLSPILARWGLELTFAEDQPMEEAEAVVMGRRVPVLLPGQFRLLAGTGNCRLWAEGVAATCKVGQGQLVALADASVVEREDPDGRREGGFGWLLDSALAQD